MIENFVNIENQIYLNILFSVLLLAGMYLIKRFLVKGLEKRVEETSHIFDDAVFQVLKNLSPILIVILATYPAVSSFQFTNDFVNNGINLIYMLSFAVQTIFLINAVVKIVFNYFINQKSASKTKKTGYTYLSKIVVVAVWIIGFLIFLSTIGIDTSSLVTSLGVGGIAVALALQNILQGIFSGFMILIFKPFQIGDYIKLDAEQKGTVKRIGLHSTYLKTISGEELIIPNDDILNSRIYNLRSRKRRRRVFDIFIDSNTSVDKIEKLKTDLAKVFEGNELINEEDSRVVFEGYNEFGAVLKLVTIIDSLNYDNFLAVQDIVNIKIKEIVEKNKVKFADRRLQTNAK